MDVGRTGCGVRAIALAAAAAAFVAGCAAGGGPSAQRQGEQKVTPPPIGSSPSPARQVSLPLDAYTFTERQSSIDARATELLTQKCMRKKGFDYHVHLPPPQSAVSEDNEPYGIIDPAKAAQYGYGQPGQAALFRRKMRIARKQERQPYRSGHSLAYRRALYGGPTPSPGPPNRGPHAGCADKAYDAVIPPRAARRAELVEQLGAQAEADTAKDPRVRKAEHAWSACMARRGFHYPTPMAASDVNWPLTPSAREIATAKADVACKRRTNLPGIWLAAEAGYERELINQHATALTQEKRDTEARIRHDEAITAKNSG